MTYSLFGGNVANVEATHVSVNAKKLVKSFKNFLCEDKENISPNFSSEKESVPSNDQFKFKKVQHPKLYDVEHPLQRQPFA